MAVHSMTLLADTQEPAPISDPRWSNDPVTNINILFLTHLRYRFFIVFPSLQWPNILTELKGEERPQVRWVYQLQHTQSKKRLHLMLMTEFALSNDQEHFFLQAHFLSSLDEDYRLQNVHYRITKVFSCKHISRCTLISVISFLVHW